MNIKTEEILNHDSIAEVEKELGGKHYSKFDNLENFYMLSKAFQDNKKKEEHLKSVNDTYFRIGWEEFKNLIKQHGFKEGLSYDLKYEDKTEEAIIYYHLEKGLILWATSFWNRETVNGGTMYGYVKANKEKLKDKWSLFNGCSHGYVEVDGVSYMEFSKDIREGLIHTINKIGDQFEYVNRWPVKPFLWFVDYVEDDEPEYDYEAITESKIKRLDKKVQNIINPV